MECLKRSFGNNQFVTPTLQEKDKLKHMPDTHMKFMVQRKTQLSFICFLYLFNFYFNITTLIDVSKVEATDTLKPIITMTIWQIVIFLVQMLLFFIARYQWNNYKISATLVILTLLLDILELYTYYIMLL